MESQNTYRRPALLFSEGAFSLQTTKEGGMSMYVTYSDLFQIGIFIVSLVGLCYTIFKGKK